MLDHNERSYLYKLGYDHNRDDFTPDEEREIRARIVAATRPRGVHEVLREFVAHCEEAVDRLICAGAREDEIGYDTSLFQSAHEIRFRDEWVLRLTREFGRTGAWSTRWRQGFERHVPFAHAVDRALLTFDKIENHPLGYHRLRVAVARELKVHLDEIGIGSRVYGADKSVNVSVWLKWGDATVHL